MGRIAVGLIVSLWVIPISIMVNLIVPDPYMDEIFHIPQAQEYCKGNFRSWDPMITTPPGLYFLSLAHVASFVPGMVCMKAASSFFNACSTASLRSTNGVLSIICSILVYEIITCLRPALDKRKATLYAVVLALYPLHWFFTFLYYTDVASLTAVLAMYALSLKKKYMFGALFGALAILVRQTNIVWVLFVACTGVIDCTLPHPKGKVQSDSSNVLHSGQVAGQLTSNKSITSDSKLRKRRSGDTSGRANHSNAKTNPSSSYPSSGLLKEIQDAMLASWHIKWELLVSFSPFFILLVAFIAFVRWNGSVVLGAKEAHSVAPHFAQLLYLSLISCLFMAPVHFTISQAAVLARSLSKNRLLSFVQMLLAFTSCFLSVHFFSIAHPYLLADNRHYPFYLWRKIIKAHWSMKYLLVPLYVYSWFSISTLLAKVQKRIWVLAFFLATAAVLIPTPLIEFRYYTIPFFFLVLHAHVNDDRSWFLMGILFVTINLFTMTMFLFRPFHWDHEPGVQRFIW